MIINHQECWVFLLKINVDGKIPTLTGSVSLSLKILLFEFLNFFNLKFESKKKNEVMEVKKVLRFDWTILVQSLFVSNLIVLPCTRSLKKTVKRKVVKRVLR